MSQKENLPVFAYWDVRCLAEHVRYMFEYLQVEYVNKHYLTGDPPTYERREWTRDKYDKSLGFDFPNVPYLVDGDVKLTESWAIMRYLARKHGKLYPTRPEDETQCDVLQGVIEDFRWHFWNLALKSDRENFRSRKAEFSERLAVFLSVSGKYLNTKQWLIGDQLTFVDFAYFEMLDQIRLMFPRFDEGCPQNVKDYLKRFAFLPAIKSYRESNRFKPLPVNSKYYYWGGRNTLEENDE